MNVRLAAWWQRFLDRQAPIIDDWPEQPDIGTDDDMFAVAEALDDPHCDPNRHWRENGCQLCRARLIRIRVMVESGRPDNFDLWAAEMDGVG